MKIIITTGAEKERKISLPTGLVLRIMLAAISQETEDGGKKKIARKTIRELSKALKKYKKENDPFTFVEVEEKNGETVKIIL